MLKSCTGIVLSAVPYSEKGLVVKIFTDKFGLQSYFVQNVKDKKSKTRQSLFAPLNIIAIEEYHNEKGQLQKIKEVNLHRHHITLHTHPYKIAVSIFCAEFLSKILSENQPDSAFFEYLDYYIASLDQEDKVADAPIAFVKAGIYFSGLYPQLNFSSREPYLSIIDAKFVPQINHKEIIGEEISENIYNILNQPITNLRLGLKNRSERLEMLKILLYYCSKHLPMTGVLKSRAVLEEVMD